MKTWKEYLSLCLALLMAVLCIAGCDSEPAETTEGSAAVTTVGSESTGETAESSTNTEVTVQTQATEETVVTQPPAVTEATVETQPPQTEKPTSGNQNQTTKPTAKPTEKPTEKPTDPPAAAGTAQNPAALVIGSNTAKTTGNGAYYYHWTAAQDGTLLINITSSKWSFEVQNLTAGDAMTQRGKSSDEPKPEWVYVAVFKGDQLQISVNTLAGTAGTVKFTVSSVDLMGTKDNPFQTNADKSMAIRVRAGETAYFGARAPGATMVISNAANAKLGHTLNNTQEEVLPSNGVIRLELPNSNDMTPPTFALTNQSGGIQVYTVTFEIPEGSYQNPKKLTLGSHTATVGSGSQGYYYEWTATADGTLTVQMEGSNWYYQLYNLDSYRVEEGNSRDNSSNPISIAVKSGQKVRITVNTADSKAGNVSFTASFQ